jgi:hypothetical protein
VFKCFDEVIFSTQMSSVLVVVQSLAIKSGKKHLFTMFWEHFRLSQQASVPRMLKRSSFRHVTFVLFSISDSICKEEKNETIMKRR